MLCFCTMQWEIPLALITYETLYRLYSNRLQDFASCHRSLWVTVILRSPMLLGQCEPGLSLPFAMVLSVKHIGHLDADGRFDSNWALIVKNLQGRPALALDVGFE